MCQILLYVIFKLSGILASEAMLALNLHLKLRSIFVYKLSHFWFNRSSVFLWQFLWKSHIFKNFPPWKPWTQISKQLRKIQGINIVLAKNFPHFGMEILVFHSAKSFWGSVVGFIFFSNFLLLAKWKWIQESFPSEQAQSYGFYLIWASLHVI